MGGLQAFFRGLGEAQRDALIAVVNESVSDDSPAQIQRLDEDIEALRRVLDERFRQSEAVKERAAQVEQLLSGLPRDSKETEIALLRGWLTATLSTLKDRLADLRPDDDLRKKRCLTQQRLLLEARRQGASVISGILLPAARGATSAR